MTLILSNEYPGRTNTPTAEYPQGSIKNRTAPGDLDGTPVDQDWLNDYVGFTAALLADAGVSASQAPDTALSSDRMRAISAAIFLRTIGALYGTGVKTYAAGVVVNTTTQRIIYRANRLYRYTGGAGVSFTCTGTWATDSAQFVIFEFAEITLKAASTSTAGTSKLNDTLISTSTTEALTANQGKVLKTVVDTAQSTADTGVSNAATAQSTANTALANAATAQSTADTGVSNAATAQSTANTALANAATAQSTANTGVSNAATAQSTANNNTAHTRITTVWNSGTPLSPVTISLPIGVYTIMTVIGGITHTSQMYVTGNSGQFACSVASDSRIIYNNDTDILTAPAGGFVAIYRVGASGVITW